jgi:hypothetical protein
MSATFGDDDFYQNLFQYMDPNTHNTLMNQIPLSFSPHEAEKHGLEDETMTDELDNKRRGVFNFLLIRG